MAEATKSASKGTVKDLSSVIFGNLGRNLLRGVFKLVVVAFLTPAIFGVVRSLYALFRLISSFAELGLDFAMVTFVSKAITQENEQERMRVLRTVLLLKILTGLTLFLAGNFFAGMIATRVFSDPDLTFYVRLAFLAVTGQLLSRYVWCYLSAHQQFGRLAWFLTTPPILLMAATFVLLALSAFDRDSAIVLYLMTPFACAILWWGAIDRGVLGKPMWNGDVARRVFRFSRWMYVTNIASANRNHVNPILLQMPALSGTASVGSINAGFYGFGADLAGEITVLSQSVLTVLLPKASAFKRGSDLRRFVKRSYFHLAWILLLLAPLVLLAEPFLQLLGTIKESYLDYLPSLDVFAALYFSGLLSMALIPMQTALYAMGRPHVETYVAVVGIFIILIGSIMMIPDHGALGAAYAVLIQRIITLIALLSYGTSKLVALGDEVL